MPDLSIPNNAIPVRFPPGTRAIADIKTKKVTNPHFWPENIPLPNPDLQFPHISLITKGFRMARKRAFDPFHYGNTFLIRTIAWLISIDFISLDDITEEDRNKLDEYRQSLEGRFVWSLDDDDLETFKPTIEMKNAWLEKYKRRDAFFHRKNVHDLVRRKDEFVTEERRKLIERRQWQKNKSGVPLKKLKLPRYHYDRDLQGGRLRRVYPPVLEKGKDPGALRRPLTKADELCEILNFPPGHLPSQREIDDAGGPKQWRAFLLERFNLEPDPTDSIMPPRRFWPIHIKARKRVLRVFPVPQTLPSSKYMLQDAPTPIVCWNRPIKVPPVLHIAEEKRNISQPAKAQGGSNGKMLNEGKAAPIKEVAAQDSGPGAGIVPSTCESLSAGYTASSQPASPSKNEDVVMADAPACPFPAASERAQKPSNADVTMAHPGHSSLNLQEHNAQAATPPSVPTQKRKRDEGNANEDLPPAKRAVQPKPSTSEKARSPLRVKPNGTNQIPSPRGRPLHLLKDSPFPSPDSDTLVIPRPVTKEDVTRLWSTLSDIASPKSLNACFEDLEADPLFCKLRTSENLRGIQAKRANPNRQQTHYETWKKMVMYGWRLEPSPLRTCITLVRNKDTGKRKYQRSEAFNHKWSLAQYREERKKQMGEPEGMVQPEVQVEDLGVVLPKFMLRKAEGNWGWRLKGRRAVFAGILPGGRLVGREASAMWTGPAVSSICLSDEAAGWTGQPLLMLFD